MTEAENITERILTGIKARHSLSPFLEGSYRQIILQVLGSGFHSPTTKAATLGASKRLACPYMDVLKLFASLCPSFTQPLGGKVPDHRKQAIRSRWKAFGGDKATFRKLFEKAEASDFLTGRKEGGMYSIGIDWLLKPANATKILEGNYDNEVNGQRPPAQQKPVMTYQQIKDRLKELRNRKEDILNPGGGGGVVTEFTQEQQKELESITTKMAELLKMRKEYYND